jgi:hypothetical protein
MAGKFSAKKIFGDRPALRHFQGSGMMRVEIERMKEYRK